MRPWSTKTERMPLPPLAAIRAFEAVARHLNFTSAARELCMTQSAVSYQIKILEDRVGTPLFVRRPRGVELTETGQRLAEPTTDALDVLRDVFGAVLAKGSKTLILSVTATFATFFLAQHLAEFSRANTSLTVDLEVSERQSNFTDGSLDAGLRTGGGKWPGLSSTLIFESRSTPMLAPQLAASVGGIRTPEDLLKLPRVKGDEAWWQAWFAAAGTSEMPSTSLTRPELGAAQALEVAAVLSGQAVGHLTPLYHRAALDDGRLIQPFDLQLPDGQSVWLVSPTTSRTPAKLNRFLKWLLEVVERESRAVALANYAASRLAASSSGS